MTHVTSCVGIPNFGKDEDVGLSLPSRDTRPIITLIGSRAGSDQRLLRNSNFEPQSNTANTMHVGRIVQSLKTQLPLLI